MLEDIAARAEIIEARDYPEEIAGSLESIKVRDVVYKLVNDSEYTVHLDDDEVNDIIERLMSEDMVDKKGNKHKSTGISCGNTLVRIIDNHFEKFRKAIKSVSPQELQEIKKQIRKAVENDPFLHKSLDDIGGIDIDNVENYLGSVEVLTIVRRRVYNIYEENNKYE